MPKIFRAQAVVTSNEAHDVFHDAFLAIDKNKIVDVGPWKKRPRSRSFSLVDATYGMITPGLFNLHTHLPMTLLRGIVEDVDFHSWLFNTIIPTETKWVGPEFVRVGAELALCEAIRNGVTFVSEMYYFESEIAAAIDRLGLRGLAAHHIWDGKTPDCATPEEAFQTIRNLAARYKKSSSSSGGSRPPCALYVFAKNTSRFGRSRTRTKFECDDSYL
jgi:5-methylthioadenosine/S-adenosylhomocysteine deaminase